MRTVKELGIALLIGAPLGCAFYLAALYVW